MSLNNINEYGLSHDNPTKIVIYARDEYKQFIMANKCKDHADKLYFLIADVRDSRHLVRALNGID